MIVFKERRESVNMKKAVSLFLTTIMALSLSTSVVAYTQVEVEDGYDYTRFADDNITLNVYNWGMYMSDENDSLEVNKAFEELTGIDINYVTYDTNETMYAKIKGGGGDYDVIFPSDYMVARMISEDMLLPLNFDNIPNYKFIGEEFKNQPFDPNDEYSIAYTWGLVGICYNTTMVDEADLEQGWDILFDEKYKGEILMVNNSRDAFGIAAKSLGMPINQTSIEEVEIITEKLKKQQPLVQSYVMDEIFDKMEGEEAALGSYYVGDGLLMNETNPNIQMYIPKEGTNYYVDSACIPVQTKNKEAAEMYINFLNETQVAVANCEYISYSTPHTVAKEFLNDDMKNSPILYPPQEIMKNTEPFVMLDEDINSAMDEAWSQIRSADVGSNAFLFSSGIMIALILIIIMILKRIKRSKMDY